MDPSWWSRLLQPTSDLGVALQLVSVLGLLGGLWWLSRSRLEWRLVVAGAAVMVVGLMALRAAH